MTRIHLSEWKSFDSHRSHWLRALLFAIPKIQRFHISKNNDAKTRRNLYTRIKPNMRHNNFSSWHQNFNGNNSGAKLKCYVILLSTKAENRKIARNNRSESKKWTKKKKKIKRKESSWASSPDKTTPQSLSRLIEYAKQTTTTKSIWKWIPAAVYRSTSISHGEHVLNIR